MTMLKFHGIDQNWFTVAPLFLQKIIECVLIWGCMFIFEYGMYEMPNCFSKILFSLYLIEINKKALIVTVMVK